MGTDIRRYEFRLFGNRADIVHSVFTRSGGTSSHPFDSLNVGFNSGDAPKNIVRNRELILSKMGMKSVVFLNQIHGDDVKIIKQGDAELSLRFEQGKDIHTADAVITDRKNLALLIQVADCQSVMLYDPQKGVIANIHSGWRGSVNNIIGRCVVQMQDEFGCRPDDMLAGISPSLGPCCAEFIHYKREIPERLWRYKAETKPYFNFWKMSEDQLTKAGLHKENIETMAICTKCRTDEFYSYRGEKITGRFACVISMV